LFNAYRPACGLDVQCSTSPPDKAGAYQLTTRIAMAHKVKGGRGNSMNQKLFPEETKIYPI
jgi:hypothetical protein